MAKLYSKKKPEKSLFYEEKFLVGLTPDYEIKDEEK
jgi:hypothetical protein